MSLKPQSSMPQSTTSSPSVTRQSVLERVRQRAVAQSATTSRRLIGKVGVITGVGPNTGIGAAAATLFARAGAARLYLLDASDKHLPSFALNFQKAYPETKIIHLVGDAASPKVISSLISRVLDEAGRLDFFFANAGVSQIQPPSENSSPTKATKEAAKLATLEFAQLQRPASSISHEEFAEIMRINALSVFLAIKYAAPAMAVLTGDKTVAGGSIVLTASVAGLKAGAGPLPYSASKAAVISMAQTSAYELTGQNVRVNAVCPGLIETDMTRSMFTLAEAVGKQDKMGTLNPLLRQGLGEEVAQVALFLASDDSSYVNGAALPVDGGLTASMPYMKAAKL